MININAQGVQAMATTITANKILNAEATQFAMFLNAYHECSEEVRAVVDEMAGIIVDPEATDEDRWHAASTMVEALLPGLTTETSEGFVNTMQSGAAKKIRQELDVEEETFANRLRQTMEEKDVSCSRLAELTGVSQPAISNLLTRKCRPHRGTVEKLAKALRVEPDALWPAATVKKT
jgi:lambda repressor-like predicted transcriptional regulator